MSKAEFPLPIPRTLADLQGLISNKVQESLFLDYKDSRALQSKNLNELSKDVSAFANAAGGILIYGIKEDKLYPVSLDSGVPATEITRETIEQKILSNGSPRLDGLDIFPIELSNSSFAYVIVVQKALQPHQDRVTHRYYKRFNFKSQPMEDYEIEDVRKRRQGFDSLISVNLLVSQAFLELAIENKGTVVAEDVKFNFEPVLPWNHGTQPHAFKNGIPKFAPGRRLVFVIGHTVNALQPASTFPKNFVLYVNYLHSGTDTSICEEFPIDVASVDGSVAESSDIAKLDSNLSLALGRIEKKLAEISSSLKIIEDVRSGTGLNLSITTLKNLSQVATGQSNFEKIPLQHTSREVLMEVLGIDFDLAWQIEKNIHWPDNGMTMEKLLVDKPEILLQLRRYFK